MTALMWASLKDHEKVVALLIAAEGVDVNSEDNVRAHHTGTHVCLTHVRERERESEEGGTEREGGEGEGRRRGVYN